MAYCAATDVTAYGNFATTDAEPYLAVLITQATAIINTYTGTSFEDGTSNTHRYYTHWDDCDSNTLWLDKWLLEVDSDGIQAGQSSDNVASTDYQLLPPNGPPYYAVRLRDNSPADWAVDDSNGDYENAIVVHGNWVYSSVVPADVKWATVRLTYWMYKQRESNADLDRPLLTNDGVTIMPTRIPYDVQAILEPYRYRVFL